MPNRPTTPLNKDYIQPHMCDLSLRLYILGRLPFFRELPAATIEVINRAFVERGFSPGENIYFEGDPATHLYVVADGQVKIMRHTTAGKDVLLDFLAMGEFFGRLAPSGEACYTDTAQAHTSICTLNIVSEEFRHIMTRYPTIALNVMDIMSERLRAANEMVRLLSVATAEQRLATIILKLAHKLGEKDKTGLLIQMPLGRSDLAEMAGATTETASRVLSQFQKEGLIHTGRQWLAITDQAGLKAVSLG